MIQVDIWSDFVCPFCYIGKRRFEAALNQFEHRDQVKVIWRSFQLDPTTEQNPKGTLNEMLATKYGQSIEWAEQMHEQVTRQAAELGLKYDFARAKRTNTYLAHQLSHLAAKHGLQDKAEEKLFSAYFTEGRHIGEIDSLVQLATEIGLDAKEAREALQSQTFAQDVDRDEREARASGANGVPFFVFNDKYAVSGAQPPELFLRALQSVWKEVQPTQS